MEYEGIKQSNKVILMKVTSRERPEILARTITQYVTYAANTRDMVWLFSFDEDDVSCNNFDFLKRIEEVIKPHGNLIIKVGKSTGKIDAINRDVAEVTSPWEILLNISDDQVPVYKGYDDVIRRFMPDNLDASLWFNDGAQDRINTQEIVGRNYYNRFNYIYHPQYKSVWCDNEATMVANGLGKLIKNGKCIIKHNHWAVKNTGVEKDQLYIKNDKYYEEDRKTFELRRLSEFK